MPSFKERMAKIGDKSSRLLLNFRRQEKREAAKVTEQQKIKEEGPSSELRRWAGERVCQKEFSALLEKTIQLHDEDMKLNLDKHASMCRALGRKEGVEEVRDTLLRLASLAQPQEEYDNAG